MSVRKLVQCFAVVVSLAVSAASAYAQNAQVRQGFWFSGGLGYGSMGCQDCGSRLNGLSGGLSLGGTISPRFLLGVGTTGWVKQDQGATLSVGTVDARMRFYPSTTGGFFLTGGLGVGSISGTLAGAGTQTETGFGAVLGLGYDIRIAKNASITPYWNSFAMSNDYIDANVGQIGLAITLH